MTPDEVRMMPNEKCLVFIRGQYPVYDYKYKTFEKKEFKEARSYGAYQHEKKLTSTESGKESVTMKDKNEVEVLSPKEVAYYQNESQGQDNISVVEITQAQLMNLDVSALEELQMTEEELKELLNDQEYRQILEASAKEDENMKEECEQLKAKITAKHPINDADLVKMSFTQRLLSGRYAKDQMEEAELGLQNGLSEEMILMYFLPGYTAAHMKEMRLLAEQTL